ncbi:MAG: hypothetical protein LBJ12_02210 [Oscillospiraceae bacterium]|nr:hypothetical protein [Oscillospiraceae bacterium]
MRAELRECDVARSIGEIDPLKLTVFAFQESFLPAFRKLMVKRREENQHVNASDGFMYRIFPEGIERLDCPRIKKSIPMQLCKIARKVKSTQAAHKKAACHFAHAKQNMLEGKQTRTYLLKQKFWHAEYHQCINLRLHVPKTTGKVPLVICLHGVGVHGNGNIGQISHFLHALKKGTP